MSTQPHLCRFSYQRYVEIVRPTFQRLLIGEWPEEVLQRYQHTHAFPETRRICPKDDFRKCTCFTADLQLNHTAPCIRPDWNWVRLFEKMLLDGCITETAYLPKRICSLHLIYTEEFSWLGLGDAAFEKLLQNLCNYWDGTWIDMDNSGVGGYLSPPDAAQFHQRLTEALAACAQQKDLQVRFTDDIIFAEFCADLGRMVAITEGAVQAGDGLLWLHDLLSAHIG